MDSDAERIERLKAVQMADLGNARRELITTADNNSNFSQVGLEELDAGRQSNIPGTKAFELAKANKVFLDRWQNFHTTINDEGSINAQLGGMMHGQSHRAQLIENVRPRPRPPHTMFQFGASQPAPSINFSNFSNPPSTNHPSPSPYRGRGRGDNGGRGRGMHSLTIPTGPRAQFTSMPSRLDPALDVNNVSSAPRGAGVSKSRKPAPSLNVKRGPPTRGTSNPLMRATKPTPLSPFKIASPQEFMAQARSPSAASGTAAPKVPSPLSPSQQPPATTSPITAPALNGKNADVATISAPQVATPTPSPRVPARKILAPRPRRVEKLAKKVEALAREVSPLKKVEVASPMIPIKIPVKATLQGDDKGKKKSESAAGLLLDFGSTAEASLITFSSPGTEELSGIDFPKETIVANVEPPSPSPVGRSPNAETIATTAQNLISAEQLSDLQIDEDEELQRELAVMFGFADRNCPRLSTLLRIVRLSSGPKHKSDRKLAEGSSSNSAETNAGSPLTNIAFPLPNVAPPAPSVASRLLNDATATEPVTPPGKNFSEYRSPPHTSSSEESKERFYDAAEMNQSPRKSVGTDGVQGFETLKVSGSSARAIYHGPAPTFKIPTAPQSSSQLAAPRSSSGSMGTSIFAKPKVIGPQPKVYDKPTGGLSYEPVTLHQLNPANAVTKPAAPIVFSPFRLGPGASANVPRGGLPPAKPVSTLGPAPYQPRPSAPVNAPKVVTPPKKEEPVSKVKFLGPAPYQPKRK
ncbi:uncharacterized protein N7503_000807 [Penicillium pulvis]|uniref:uncharacterized protein n=1 Tax=Penicillium pulvis TaxID=1562058 RepID=UPI0025481DE0|nr:uncharacterized protein N7503_000807 [Penicillium pulvis]KAJ5814057.1 hypothetical protein N7503_000807 [Penicillium pulvis]